MTTQRRRGQLLPFMGKAGDQNQNQQTQQQKAQEQQKDRAIEQLINQAQDGEAQNKRTKRQKKPEQDMLEEGIPSQQLEKMGLDKAAIDGYQSLKRMRVQDQFTDLTWALYRAQGQPIKIRNALRAFQADTDSPLQLMQLYLELANNIPNQLKTRDNSLVEVKGTALSRGQVRKLTNMPFEDFARYMQSATQYNLIPRYNADQIGKAQGYLEKRQKLYETKPKSVFPQFAKGAALQAFPQWAMKQAKKRDNNNQQSDYYRLLQNQQKKQDSKVLDRLNELDPKMAYWDPYENRWAGTYVNKVNKQLVNKQALIKRNIKKNKDLISTQLTAQQVQAQVPSFIRAIVQSNDALSQTGFGQISYNNGINLYAGRWLDNSTGKIRLLPAANIKYINPLSYQQKKGYLQAKVINHWNEMVNAVASLQKFQKISSGQYKSKQLNRLKNSLNTNNLLVSQANLINNRIINFRMALPRKTATYYLMSEIPTQKLKQIYAILPGKIDDQNIDVLIEGKLQAKISLWTQAVDDALQRTTQLMKSNLKDQGQRQTATIALNKAAYEMTSGPTRRVTRALVDIEKAALIPMKISALQMVDVAQQVDEAKQKIRQTTSNALLRGISKKQSESMNSALKAFEKAIDTEKVLKLDKYDQLGKVGKTYLKTFGQLTKNQLNITNPTAYNPKGIWENFARLNKKSKFFPDQE